MLHLLWGRVKHLLRSDTGIELLGSKESEGNGSLLEGRSLLVCLLGALGDVCEGGETESAWLWQGDRL